MRSSYWWADEGRILVNHLTSFRDDSKRLTSNPLYLAWVRNLFFYYSPLINAQDWMSSLGFEGEQGELVRMCVPEAKSLVNQMISLVTKQRLSFQVLADKKGEDVIKAARIGNSLNSNIIKEQRLETKKRELAEQAAVLGASHLVWCWRTDKGKPFAGGENGEMQFTGDLEMRLASVFDVHCDPQVVEHGGHWWKEFRVLRNRWDLVAQFPELADRIISLPSAGKSLSNYDSPTTHLQQDDLIWCYEAYHITCPALRPGWMDGSDFGGRMIFYADPDTIFHDGPNVFGVIPAEEMRPEPLIHIQGGFPFLSQLLPCQEMLDHNLSAISTAANAFAVPTIFHPNTTAIEPEMIGGMKFVPYQPLDMPGGGKPEVANMFSPPGELFKFSDTLVQHMQRMSNLNSAVRGEPPAGVTSGKAIATLTVNALEFLNNFSESYHSTLERGMDGAMKTYKLFAKAPRQLVITQGKESFSEEFNQESLKGIEGTRIIVSNPLMATLAGRTEFADRLFDKGRISTGQYFRVTQGAPETEVFAAELAEEDLIAAENQAFMEGRPVLTLKTDDHPKHIKEHKAMLANPDVRMNNAIVAEILPHIEEHWNLVMSTDPAFLAMANTGLMQQMQPQEAAQPADMMNPEQSFATKPAIPAEDAVGRQQLETIETAGQGGV